MLVWLAQFLQQYISGFSVVQYLTLRGILGVLTALGISLLLGPWFINKLIEKQVHRRAEEPSEQAGHADHGRSTTAVWHNHQRLSLVGFEQSLCAGGPVYHHRLWRRRLGR